VKILTDDTKEHKNQNKVMNKPHAIIVFGANGSGKTTLGCELARILNYKHIDIEDYAFQESEIPYAKERSREDCISLMLADIEKHRSFIITAVTGDFGNVIPRYYDLAVYLSAPVELRLERIEQREYEKFGDRVRVGGDMHEQRLKFHDFVASRPLSRIKQWAKTLSCPVICIDGTEDWHTNAAKIAKRYHEIYAGDTFAYDAKGYESKDEREKESADKLFSLLPAEQATAYRSLWEEFDRMETPDAIYASAVDRFQPFLNNYLTAGYTWVTYGVSVDQVYKRMAPVKITLPELWEFVEFVIRDSCEKGYIIPEVSE
jgi:adenylate kinase family enzyme